MSSRPVGPEAARGRPALPAGRRGPPASAAGRGPLHSARMTRRGASLLVVVLGAAAVLLAWAGTQRASTTSVRRRQRFAAAARRSFLRATEAADEALAFVDAAALETDTGPGTPGEWADRVRQLAPGEVLEVDYAPALAGASSPPPEGIPAGTEATLSVWFVAIDVPGLNGDPLLGGVASSALRARGIAQARALAWEVVGGQKVGKWVTIRPLLLVPLAEAGDALPPEGAALLLHPTELGRQVTTLREPYDGGAS